MPRLARLRSKLLLLAVGSLLPVLALAWVLAWVLLDHERATVRSVARDRNRTFLAAVDAAMQGHLQSLRALSVSSSLQQGDLRTFDAVARRVLPTQHGWRNIMVLDASGRHLVNMRLPYGSPDMPQATGSELAMVRRALASDQPVIGNLARGPATGRFGLAVRMRVAAAGHGPLVLQFVLDPDALAPLMRMQDYPSGWFFGLADRQGQFIARMPQAPAGQRISQDFAVARATAAEGWYRGHTLEGKDTYTAFMTSPRSGWTVGVAIPRSEVTASAWRAAAAIAAGALASLLLALVLAALLGRRIARPISRLADAARHLGRRPIGADLAAVKQATGVTEVHAVASALEEADAGLREREALRLREQEALRAADQAKDELLAMLGHELRNPLSAITASAHVLRLSSPDAPAAGKAHEVIDRQARQMTRLAEDLMDVSRLAMGKVTLQPGRLDLGALAERVVHSWQQGGRTRAGRVRLATEPAWVDGDRERLEQVLANLLDNAHKFSTAPAPIEVRVHAEDGQAVLEVQDHGEGIGADDLPRIFDLFVQGAQRRRQQGGIGLGLTLVRRLVELQHGTVSARSGGTGQGACFTVRLPLAAPAPDGAAPLPPAPPVRGRRVLLVEDNEDGRQMLESVLALQGHTVRAVASGEEAVRVAAAWRPDVALVDIGLPGIDGHEVARRIRALSLLPQPRLVAVSGYGQPQDQRSAYEAGFDLHLVKPLAPEFLRDVMQALGGSKEPSR